MKSDSDNLLVSTILQDAPKTIQTFTEKDVQKSIDLVKDTLSYFKVKKVEQLLRINDSPKYLKRLYDQFQSKKKSIERCIKNQQLLKERQKELTKEEAELNEKLKLIIKKSKELQKYICEDLSKKYNGVRINIMGEINLL
jgi:predicted Zn-dependent protease